MSSYQSAVLPRVLKPFQNFLFSDLTSPSVKRMIIDSAMSYAKYIHPADEEFYIGSMKAARFGSGGITVLYLHGGGYVFGSIDSHRPLLQALGKQVGLQVVAINYRLAPENKFPAAVEDAVQAYQWLLDEGHPPGNIAIAGDSAGGGLAMALLLAIKDKNMPLPSSAVCISPWVDLTASGESVKTRVHRDPMLLGQSEGHFAAQYASREDWENPYASPLFGDLSGLPRVLVHVGTEEILFSDAVRLTEKLQSYKVRARLRVWEGQVHVFHLFHSILPEAREAIKEIAEFIRS